MDLKKYLLEFPALPVHSADVKATKRRSVNQRIAGPLHVTESDVNAAYTFPGCVDPDLKRIEFSSQCVALEAILQALFNPSQRKILGHTYRVPPVFREQNVRRTWNFREQLASFFRRGDHLHRIETVKLIDGLHLHYLCLRQNAPAFLWQSAVCISATFEPCRVRGLFGLEIADLRIVSAGHLVGHVIHVILTRDSDRLKDEISEFSVDFDRIDVAYSSAGLGVYENDFLLLRIEVTPAPRNMNRHGTGGP